MRNLTHLLAGLAIGAMAGASPVSAQDGKALFTDNCAPCHSIGGGAGIGPDLRDLGTRRNSDWVMRFVADPEGMTKSGDAYAITLATKFDNTIMPPAALSRDQIALILQYIDAESSTAPRAARPAPPPPGPVFTPVDVSRGRALFVGSTRLSGGGPSCLSCHAAGGEPGFGGGALGPNLSAVARRLNGAKGTAAWLAAPPTPVMKSVFRPAPLTPAEVTALTAFLSDRAVADAASPVGPAYVVSGVFVAIVLLGLIGFAWRGRLRPVRRGIVSGGLR